MKILMVGAGAVGGYFGALIHQSGEDITFLVRPRTFEAIHQNGLRVESYKGNFTVHPKLALAENLLPGYDLIIFSVKCYDLENALRQAAQVVSPGTLLLTLQNGVTAEEEAVRHFGGNRVLGGVVFITSRLIEPGRIGHYKRGILTLGELSGQKTERLTRIHDLLTKAQITTYLTDDIIKKKWEKLCWNASFNPLSVLLDGTVSSILESKGACDVIHQVIIEIRKIARESGIILDENIAYTTVEASHGLKEYHTSMYEDWKGGKKTENEFLNGYLYRKGIELQIPVPLNFALYQAIEALTRKNSILPAPSF